MYEKITYIVIGVAIKYVFDLWQSRRTIEKLKAALIEELEDIKHRLREINFSYARALQIFALNGIEPTAQIHLSNKIYEKHYVDVALSLGASQRRSFSLVHGYVDSVNRGIDLTEERLKNIRLGENEEDLKEWGDLIKAQYMNTVVAYWHVAYHLANKDMPYLGEEGSEAHAMLMSEIKNKKKHMKKIMEDARSNLTREGFE